MRALVLAGGHSQIFLIKEIKSRGIYTILADNSESALAIPYADKFRKVNILDYDAVEKVAREENVDFIVTACADQIILTMAKVSERLNKPCYVDYATAAKVSDKSSMKQICREYDIPTSKSIVLQQLDYNALESFRYPLVVKPTDGYSAKGITKVLDKDGLQHAFERALAAGRTKDVIIEEFIDGSEVTIDGYCEDGKAILLSVSNTEKLKLQDLFLAYRTWYPATVSDVVHDKIEKTMQKIADACKLKNGPMHCQMIVDGDDIFVLEFCARTGGGAKYTLVRRATGFDPFKPVVDLALGKVYHYERKAPEAKYISNLFLYGKTGFFDHVEGFEELLNKKVICDYCVFRSKGSEIKGVSTSSDRVASITVEADSLQEMQEKFDEAVKNIKAISTEGVDLIRRELIGPLEYSEVDGKAVASRW